MNRSRGPADRAEHLFVVRMWQERSDAAEASQWRGAAQHVPSGERAYFMQLTDLNEFIRSQLARPQPAGPMEGERVAAAGPPDEGGSFDSGNGRR